MNEIKENLHTIQKALLTIVEQLQCYDRVFRLEPEMNKLESKLWNLARDIESMPDDDND